MLQRTNGNGSNRRRSGTTMVETVLIISMCLLVVFGIYEYGRLLMVQNLMESAAREGARYAVVHTSDKTTADVQDRVRSAFGGQDFQLHGFNVQVYQTDNTGNNTGSWNAAQFGQYIAVQIDGDYKPILPVFLFMNATMHLSHKSVMYSDAH